MFSAVDALLGTAQGKVTVYELEPEQEVNMVDFTAELRYFYDNQSGSVVDVYSQFMTLMGNHGFDPRRVTYSGGSGNSTNPTGNCTNIYTDWSRQFGVDSILSGIGGGLVGLNYDASGGTVPGLWCGGTSTGTMLSSPISHSLPHLVDVHAYPSSNAGSTDPYVQTVAGVEYSDLSHLYPLLGLSFSSTALVIGETYSGTSSTCVPPVPPSSPSAAPSENVAGFNASSLAGNPVVFRPWLEIEDPTGTCYPYPTYQNVNSQGTGPYTPTQQ